MSRRDLTDQEWARVLAGAAEQAARRTEKGDYILCCLKTPSKFCDFISNRICRKTAVLALWLNPVISVGYFRQSPFR